MALNGIWQRRVYTSHILTFKISLWLSEDEQHSVEKAWTVRDLNLPKMNIDMPREKTKWPHIADLNLPKVNGGLAIVLGADVLDLIVPLEVQTGPKGTPCRSYSSRMDGCSTPTWPNKGNWRFTYPLDTRTSTDKSKSGEKLSPLGASTTEKASGRLWTKLHQRSWNRQRRNL